MNRLLLVLFLFSPTLYANSQCSVTALTNPAGYSNNTSVGSFAWSNLSNVQLNDNNYATAGQSVGILSSVNSNYLIASNFGFSIPSSATICGIIVEVERNASGLIGIGASITDNSLKIVKAGAIAGTDHASGAAWPSSEAYASYGNSTDSWGTTWTPSQINASNFGIAISAKLTTGLAALFLTPGIDHIRISVYFNVVVPITLKSFTAKQVSDKVRLDWITATETNNRFFLIQKSLNSFEWSTIDSIPVTGNSYDDKSYHSYDNFPSPVNYYRLKQVDVDGKISLSGILKINASTGLSSATKIYPNPVKGTYFTITVPSGYHWVYRAEIIDQSGRIADAFLLNTEEKNIKVTLHKKLPTGIYTVRLFYNNGQNVYARIVIAPI